MLTDDILIIDMAVDGTDRHEGRRGEEQEKKSIPDNILTKLSTPVEQLSGREKELFVEIISFCKRLTDRFEEKFLTLLRDEQTKVVDPREKVKDFLIKHDMTKPWFMVMDKAGAESFFEKFNLSPIEHGGGVDVSLIVLFNTPKPLEQWWSKGRGNWGEEYVDIHGMAIEWGRYYREIMPIVWNETDVEDEEGMPLKDVDWDFFVNRLNPMADHVPGWYYYVWQFNKPSLQSHVRWAHLDIEYQPPPGPMEQALRNIKS